MVMALRADGGVAAKDPPKNNFRQGMTNAKTRKLFLGRSEDFAGRSLGQC
jgi:hypothetical protein